VLFTCYQTAAVLFSTISVVVFCIFTGHSLCLKRMPWAWKPYSPPLPLLWLPFIYLMCLLQSTSLFFLNTGFHIFRWLPSFLDHVVVSIVSSDADIVRLTNARIIIIIISFNEFSFVIQKRNIFVTVINVVLVCWCNWCRKMQDPLNNLSFAFKKNLERMQTQRKNPKLLLALYDHVHPDLSVNTQFFWFWVWHDIA